MGLKDKIQQLREKLQDVAGDYALKITGLSVESHTKLDHLRASGRDFLSLATSEVRSSVARFVKAELEGAIKSGKVSLDKLIREEGGGAVKRVFLLRFREQGNDVKLRPLSPAYKKRKTSHGYDGRIGVRTGHLLAEIAAATFELVKR